MSKIVNWLINTPPLYALMKIMAKQAMKNSAESRGISWDNYVRTMERNEEVSKGWQMHMSTTNHAWWSSMHAGTRLHGRTQHMGPFRPYNRIYILHHIDIAWMEGGGFQKLAFGADILYSWTHRRCIPVGHPGHAAAAHCILKHLSPCSYGLHSVAPWQLQAAHATVCKDSHNMEHVTSIHLPCHPYRHTTYMDTSIQSGLLTCPQSQH